jgi:hypothetical protein
MENVKRYMFTLSRTRKAEKRSRKMKKRFENYMKTAIEQGRIDLAKMSLNCIETMKNVLKSLEEDRRNEREKMRTHPCAICLEEMKTNIVMLPCGHLFHEECHENWSTFNRSCAVCRCNTQLHSYELCDDCAAAATNLPHAMIRKGLQTACRHSQNVTINCHST